jgi:predicted nucleic acid-binding protein
MEVTIAATALTHDATGWTQDDDFDVLRQLAPGLRAR